MSNAALELEKKANIWLAQMAGVLAMANELGRPAPDISVYYKKINELYSGELAFANLMDCSDLVFYANGPSIDTYKAKLKTVTSLFENIDKQLRTLAFSVLQTGFEDAKKMLQKIDLRLTGTAPGSLYAGFLVEPPQASELLGTEEQNLLMAGIKLATGRVAEIPNFIDGNVFSKEGLAELFLDPAVRDSAIFAAYKLSPTGKNGIDTLQIINPKNNFTTKKLVISDRATLKTAIESEPIVKSKSVNGAFEGYLSRIDLDSLRVSLRDTGVNGLTSLRCVLPSLTVEKGREILGQRVRVDGYYEKTITGKPSLMQITKIEVVPRLF
jgi:hypothetical protein